MDQLIDDLIKLSFAEDIGDGDHTTLCCIPETAMGKSQLIIKEDGVLAGVEMAKRIFHDFDPELKMTIFINDGAEVKKGDIAFTVEGKVQSLLQTERLMLNVMQRMSGIATTTRKYVKALEGTKTRVLDTRKTTPGMRMMEKDAVKIGGGVRLAVLVCQTEGLSLNGEADGIHLPGVHILLPDNLQTFPNGVHVYAAGSFHPCGVWRNQGILYHCIRLLAALLVKNSGFQGGGSNIDT